MPTDNEITEGFELMENLSEDDLNKTGELSPRQEAFCWEYVIHMNASKAARNAGYSLKGAQQQGSRLLLNVVISTRISEIRANSAGKFDLGKESLIQELANIAKFDLREVYNEDGTLKKPSEWSDEAGSALAGVEIDEIFDTEGTFKGYTKKVKRDNKIAAISELNKMLGHYAPTKAEVHNTGNVQINFIPSTGNDPISE